MKRPFLALVAPLKLALDGSQPPCGMATVFVSDPHVQVEAAEEVTQRLFGLTAAEARAANALAARGSVDEAAQTLCMSRETLRWHLRHIYRKTGTHRQAALLTRLVNGTGPLVPEQAALTIRVSSEAGALNDE